MRGVNKVIILGYLGNDPETRQIESGAIVNFSVATSDRWKDAQGETHERTQWHRICCFGGMADLASKYLSKGSKVYIEGRLRTRKYTDTAGIERYVTDIIAIQVEFLDSKSGNSQQQIAKHDSFDMDEEIPF